MKSQDHRVITIHNLNIDNIDIRIVIPTQGGTHIIASLIKALASQEFIHLLNIEIKNVIPMLGGKHTFL